MSLFELTCIVTGGNSTTRWWCWLLAWFIAIIIILYCVMIIVSMLISMSNFEMANDRLDYSNEKNKVNKDDANIYAKNLLIENSYKEVSQKPPVHTTSHTSPSVMHEMQDMQVSQSPSVNTMSQQPSLSQKQPPSYSEPKHNVAAGNMLSFPQNSSDLSGFDTNDNYLTHIPKSLQILGCQCNVNLSLLPVIHDNTHDNTHDNKILIKVFTNIFNSVNCLPSYFTQCIFLISSPELINLPDNIELLSISECTKVLHIPLSLKYLSIPMHHPQYNQIVSQLQYENRSHIIANLIGY